MSLNLPRLAGLLHHLPDARDLRLVDADGVPHALPWQAVEVYAAVPELVEFVRQRGIDDAIRRATKGATPADIREALRLPASTPWGDVLARARSLADRDPARTLDDEGLGGGDGGGR